MISTSRPFANLDFDLFIALAKHPRLGLKQAIQLLDLLGIMCLNDPVFGRAASVPFLIVVNRLHAQRPLIEYIDRFSKVALSMFVHVETTLLQATRMSQYKTQALRKKAGKKKEANALYRDVRRRFKLSDDDLPFVRTYSFLIFSF